MGDLGMTRREVDRRDLLLTDRRDLLLLERRDLLLLERRERLDQDFRDLLDSVSSVSASSVISKLLFCFSRCCSSPMISVSCSKLGHSPALQ